MDKLIPFSAETKLRFYLDLEWIFERLAHEKSFGVFHEHPVRDESFRFLHSHLSSDYRVLDLGCGTGALGFMISIHAKRVVAIDHNSQLIDAAKKNHARENLEFQSTDALDYLAATKEQFDVLILSHVLEHLEEPGALLRQYKDFFQFIYIEVPDFERTHLNLYRKQLNASLLYSDADHIWEFDRKDMAELIQESGLTLIDEEFRLGVQKYWCKNSSSQDNIS